MTGSESAKSGVSGSVSVSCSVSCSMSESDGWEEGRINVIGVFDNVVGRVGCVDSFVCICVGGRLTIGYGGDVGSRGLGGL